MPHKILATALLDKVIGINRVSDRMIVIKILVMDIIISVISVYVPQCSLDDSEKDDFYDDSLINIVRQLGEKEIVVMTEDIESHWT